MVRISNSAKKKKICRRVTVRENAYICLLYLKVRITHQESNHRAHRIEVPWWRVSLLGYVHEGLVEGCPERCARSPGRQDGGEVGEGRKEGNGNHLTASDIYLITQSRLWNTLLWIRKEFKMERIMQQWHRQRQRWQLGLRVETQIHPGYVDSFSIFLPD